MSPSSNHSVGHSAIIQSVIRRSFGRSSDHSVNHPIIQSVIRSFSQSSDHSVGHPIIQSIRYSVGHPIIQPAILSFSRSSNHSVGHPIVKSVIQSFSRSSGDHPAGHPIIQSIIQSFSRSSDHSVGHKIIQSVRVLSQPFSQSLVWAFSPSVNRSFSRSIGRWIQPISQSAIQSVNQSENSPSQSVSHTISLSVRVVKEERLFRDVNKIIKQALQYAMKKWVFFKGKLSLGYYYLNGPFPALWSFDFRIILSTIPNATTNSGESHRARRSLIIEKLIWFSNEWYVNPV